MRQEHTDATLKLDQFDHDMKAIKNAGTDASKQVSINSCYLVYFTLQLCIENTDTNASKQVSIDSCYLVYFTLQPCIENTDTNASKRVLGVFKWS